MKGEKKNPKGMCSLSAVLLLFGRYWKGIRNPVFVSASWKSMAKCLKLKPINYHFEANLSL
jgi:hypothetical protein